MASYLSYFTSGNSSTAPSQSHGTPSTGSTWSSTFSSRIATLRKALTKDAEEDDPDNEDCSHVSNVLRAYYTEKGRTFPEWLPPDPKKPMPAPVPPPSQYGQFGNTYGNQYGSQYGSQPAHGRGSSGGRGGLSDLWDSSPTPPPQPQPQSLRAPRPSPQALRSNDSDKSQISIGGTASPYLQPSSGARPLPSQRAGSYQNTQNNTSTNPSALGSRDRLRARLQGGGSGRSSPVPPSSGQTTYASAGGNYDSGGTHGSPYVSASEPWSSGNNPYQPDASQHSASNNPYGNQGYRQRPGGPR